MKNVPRIIEVIVPIDLVNSDEAILPTPASCAENPTTIMITPSVITSVIDGRIQRALNFRVAFEPNNQNRRNQPYRNTLDPVFPNTWKYNDPWPLADDEK